MISLRMRITFERDTISDTFCRRQTYSGLDQLPQNTPSTYSIQKQKKPFCSIKNRCIIQYISNEQIQDALLYRILSTNTSSKLHNTYPISRQQFNSI